jgi:hypothetical protein
MADALLEVPETTTRVEAGTPMYALLLPDAPVMVAPSTETTV